MARVHVHAGPVTVSSGGKKNGGSGIGTVIIFLIFIVAVGFAIFPPLGILLLVVFFILGIMTAIGSVLPDPKEKNRDELHALLDAKYGPVKDTKKSTDE